MEEVGEREGFRRQSRLRVYLPRVTDTHFHTECVEIHYH